MDLSKLKEQLITHEGFALKPYTDTVGKITIGVGHNLTDNGLSTNMVNLLLEEDIANVGTFLEARIPWSTGLDEVRLRALYDLAFNMGPRLLTFTTTLEHLKAGRYSQAADSLMLSKYAKQVGQRAKDIAFMIKTGQDPHD